MKEINANNGSICLDVAGMVVDRALMAGFDLSQLRWVVGYAQRAAMYHVGLSLAHENAAAAPSSPHQQMRFCGVPVVLDDSMPKDEIRLEMMRPVDSVSLVKVATPFLYES